MGEAVSLCTQTSDISVIREAHSDSSHDCKAAVGGHRAVRRDRQGRRVWGCTLCKEQLKCGELFHRRMKRPFELMGQGQREAN